MTATDPAVGAITDATRAARDAMVDRLKERIIRDPRIEAAFRAVPRHLFLPDVPLEKVYSGDVIPTRFNERKQPISSSSEVAVMAIMAEQLKVEPGQRVLEIGAGTGYNAAILADLVGEAGRVSTVDIDPEIAAEARARLDAAGYGPVRVATGDGWDGLPDGAPYDRIELTASASDLSLAWVEQLTGDGILLVPFWLRTGWQMLVAFRKQDGSLRSVSVRGGGFMPLRGLGAPADPGIWRDGWRVAGSRKDDRDAIFALLKTEPTVVLGPEYDPSASWERMTAISSDPAVISVSHTGRGSTIGLYDPRTHGLAVAAFTYLSHLGPRIQYVLHGDPGGLQALRAIVEEGPKSCAELDVEAVPMWAPVGDGAVPRRSFRVVVRRRELRATSQTP